jgi:hypothetical protein
MIAIAIVIAIGIKIYICYKVNAANIFIDINKIVKNLLIDLQPNHFDLTAARSIHELR